MIWITLSVVVTLGLFIWLGLDLNEGKFKLRARQVLSLFGLSILLFGMFKIIPVNSVGIIFNPFTGVQEQVLTEGFRTKTPLDEIYIISTEVQTKTVTGVTGQTKDAQWIKIDMDIKYNVSKSNAFVVFKKFKTLQNVDEKLLQPIVQRAVEQVTTQYNVIDILGEKRNEVYIQIERGVTAKLAESGVELFSLVLTDTDAGTAIESAIEAEAVAKKAVETASQVQAKAGVEAQTKVIQAEADARVKLVQAEADAKVKVIAAEAEAESNRLISNSLTQALLTKMEMEARLVHGWVTIQGADAIVVK